MTNVGEKIVKMARYCMTKNGLRYVGERASHTFSGVLVIWDEVTLVTLGRCLRCTVYKVARPPCGRCHIFISSILATSFFLRSRIFNLASSAQQSELAPICTESPIFQYLFSSPIMAPYLEEPLPYSTQVNKNTTKGGSAISSFVKKPTALHYEPGRNVVEAHDEYEHDDLRPIFPSVHWEPLTEVPYQDRGIQGDPQFRSLLADATDIFDYNPKIGTEIHGLNLANLTDAQKNDLARLISIRGVVFFRNQTDLDVDAQRELGQYFGKLHKHATTSTPRRPGLEDVHVVYTDEKSKEQRANFAPTFLWHSDVSQTSEPNLSVIGLTVFR